MFRFILVLVLLLSNYSYARPTSSSRRSSFRSRISRTFSSSRSRSTKRVDVTKNSSISVSPVPGFDYKSRGIRVPAKINQNLGNYSSKPIPFRFLKKNRIKIKGYGPYPKGFLYIPNSTYDTQTGIYYENETYKGSEVNRDSTSDLPMLIFISIIFLLVLGFIVYVLKKGV